MDFRAGGLEHLADQQSELSVAEHCHGVAGRNSYLLKDLAGRGQRFDEHGLFGRDIVGNQMQIAFGQR